MAVGSGTFTGDLLARLGVDNVLADSPERYPRFTPPVAGVDLVVLPDEPYLFTPEDGPEAFPGVPSACVSGRHLTWYGPSLAEARGPHRAARLCDGLLRGPSTADAVVLSGCGGPAAGRRPASGGPPAGP